MRHFNCDFLNGDDFFKMERSLTSGSVWKNIVRFSLPFLLSYFLQTLYGMADLYIIGQFEPVAATTAVSVGSQVMHMLTVMLVGLAMGTTVSIGQAMGRKNKKEAAEYIGSTVSLFIAVAVLITVVLILLREPIVSVMSTPEAAVDGTLSYLTICFIGIPFITAYNIIASIYRGVGDSKTPMYFVAVACVANIALDYLFIGALNLGVAGAALGTTVSQAISVIISLIAISKSSVGGIKLSKADLRPNATAIKQIIKVGLPVMLQDGFIQVSFMVITIIANKRGLTDAAAVGIVEKIIGFVFLVPSSMLSTVSALSAQNIGAGRRDRAKQTLGYGILICVGFGLIISGAVQFIAEPIVALFTDRSAADGAQVIIRGGQYIRSYIFDCLFAGIHFSFSGYFCAVGKSGLSFMHNIISILLIRIPGAYLTSMLFPETLFPMGLASTFGSVLSSIICFAAFMIIERKLKNELTLK